MKDNHHQRSTAPPAFDAAAAAASSPAAAAAFEGASAPAGLPPLPGVASSFDSPASAASTIAAGNEMLARMDAFAAADVDKLLGSAGALG